MSSITEPARQTPILAEYDTVVVGGGIAGVAAALASARNGASTCLVEKESAMGGLATLGLIAIYLPLCDGTGTQVIGGLGEELLKLSVRYGGPDRIPACWLPGGNRRDRARQRYLVEFNPMLFIIALEELLLETGVDIRYNTLFCGVRKEGERIAQILVENKDGRGALSARAVVDASGDADVCRAAGERTAVYRENRLAAWYYMRDGAGVRLNKLAQNLYGKLPDGARTYDGDSDADRNAMLIDGRRQVLQDILHRRREQRDEEIAPVTLPMTPSFRMTRRLAGLHEIQESDDHRYCDDCIGITGDWRKRGPIHYLPFRSLIGATVENLITAGRCISANTDAWDVTRAIPTCAVTGEAAGTAAALSIAPGGFRRLCVTDLREKLRAQGAFIDPVGE